MCASAYGKERLQPRNCTIKWDTVSCWPETLPNAIAVLRCPENLAGVDHTQNVTRHCHSNGTWAAKANYASCFPEVQHHVHEDFNVISIIYHFGFCVSTVALIVALLIFIWFGNLRCLRNNIHCNLILTFIMRNIIWIAMRHSVEEVVLKQKHLMWVCQGFVIAFSYFQSTHFYWMFAEGLYLHIIVVWTYSADKMHLWHFLLIGWGLPVPFILVWAVIQMKRTSNDCWTKESIYDYIHHIPVFVVLLANVIFFISILWILITKLRMTNTPEATDYRKAVKAAIVLLPLLGITYVIFIMQPDDSTPYGAAFIYIDTVLQSFQGLLVALFYCFLNGEVRQTLRMKLKCCQNSHSRTTATRCSRISSLSLQKQAMTINLAMQQELLYDQKLNGTKEMFSMSDDFSADKQLSPDEEETRNFMDTGV
ncbi:corticotropin-releasing factor receptor 2-like [Octopus vulgaris]|uniref:Corticotropin-releasing factor receptor 2-like n=1 Tax=Octopus vulgaris TaxID=6645 RepID=A0AA36BKY5_OCTVU|nr:corticotropin-releasing factor receptor 2-like [Octopus vulgaris]